MPTKESAIAALVVCCLATAAFSQVTSSNLEGPTLTIDFLRVAGPDSAPAIDPLTGGLTYVVGVTPDASFPTFTPEGAGFNGPGGAVAVELGFLVGGAGLSDDAPAPASPLPSDFFGPLPSDPAGQVVVNVNSTPGEGSTSTEPDDGYVDFANPGNVIFGFETPLPNGNPGTTNGGVQVGIDPSSGLDAVYAALGLTFIDANDIGLAPFEILRIKTARLDRSAPDSLAPSLAVVDGSITAQSIDLSDPSVPLADTFLLPFTQSQPITVGDATLDGEVNLQDFNSVVAGFGAGTLWNAGNFDGEGSTTDADDLNTVLANFDTTGSAPTSDAVSIDAEIVAAFTNDDARLPVDLSGQAPPPGQELVLQVDIRAALTAAAAAGQDLGNIAFDLVLDGVEQSDDGYIPAAGAAAPAGEAPTVNGDFGVPDDLRDIVASFVVDTPGEEGGAPSLAAASTVAAGTSSEEPETIGSVFVVWDGVSPATITIEAAEASLANELGDLLEPVGVAAALARIDIPDFPAAGDFNADGLVNASDYVVFRDLFGADESGLGNAFDNDGVVGIGDYELFRENFNSGAFAAASAASSAVAAPEPTSVVLLALGAGLIGTRTQRRKAA